MLGESVYHDESQPWLGTYEVADSKPWYLRLGDAITKVIDAAKTVQPAVSDLQAKINAIKATTSATTSGAMIPGANQPILPQEPGMSTGAKVAIGVGFAAAVGMVIYAATRKSRKK